MTGDVVNEILFEEHTSENHFYKENIMDWL